jgi:hypothetical protein
MDTLNTPSASSKRFLVTASNHVSNVNLGDMDERLEGERNRKGLGNEREGGRGTEGGRRREREKRREDGA